MQKENTENLVDQRDSWRRNFDNGSKPSSPLLFDYRMNRDSTHWRVSSHVEELCEYILWLEDQMKDVDKDFTHGNMQVKYEHEGFVLNYEITNTDNKPWTEVLQTHINFLRGLGYVIPDDVDVV